MQAVWEIILLASALLGVFNVDSPSEVRMQVVSPQPETVVSDRAILSDPPRVPKSAIEPLELERKKVAPEEPAIDSRSEPKSVTPKEVVHKSSERPSCHPSYSGCLNPGAIDYDCAGGSGNGPYFTGPVRVYGPDAFDLDRDNDGMACE